MKYALFARKKFCLGVKNQTSLGTRWLWAEKPTFPTENNKPSFGKLHGQAPKGCFLVFLWESCFSEMFWAQDHLFPGKHLVFSPKTNIFQGKLNRTNKIFGVWPYNFQQQVFFFYFFVFTRKSWPKTIFFLGNNRFFGQNNSFLGKIWVLHRKRKFLGNADKKYIFQKNDF